MRRHLSDAISNNSKRSMMPAGHHSDSDSTLLPLPKSAITWFGGIFARLREKWLLGCWTNWRIIVYNYWRGWSDLKRMRLILETQTIYERMWWRCYLILFTFVFQQRMSFGMTQTNLYTLSVHKDLKNIFYLQNMYYPIVLGKLWSHFSPYCYK